MKNIYLLVCSFLICSQLHSQIILDENFDDGKIPEGWSIETMATDGGWKAGTSSQLSSSFFVITQNGSSGIVATNDDACNCDKSNDRLISPAMDLSGYENIILAFDVYYLDMGVQGFVEEFTVEISTDGTNWTVIEDLHGHGSWDTHKINISDYAGEPSVYISFKYNDGGGWVFGSAIDNVLVEEPLVLDSELVDVNSFLFGEVGREIPISGTIFNNGSTAITSLDIAYSIDGGIPVNEQISGINIPSFTFYNFHTSSGWTPDTDGFFTIEIDVSMTNGQEDQNLNNNKSVYTSQIYPKVEKSNDIVEIMNSVPVFTEVANQFDLLDRPTDLDFFPVDGKDELWVINQRVESSGGSTLTISDASTNPNDYNLRVDGNAWHFMSLPTAIAFSTENYNFGTTAGVQDANHSGGTFTGPTLWSSDPAIYAQPSGGNGSHLDMLHGSPLSMGIAHEVDNVFWVYDNWNKDIVRYDFVEDHGPGNDDHSDAIIRRYKNIGISADSNIPNHMILDKESGWLYFVDNGKDRVMRLDINSGGIAGSIPEINEPLAEHSQMGSFVVEEVISEGLVRPCGIEIVDDLLLVGDYGTGDIIVYNRSDFTEEGRIATGSPGLSGIKIGPDGSLWYVNREMNTLVKVEAGESTSAEEIALSNETVVYPNPANTLVNIKLPDALSGDASSLELLDIYGKRLAVFTINGIHSELDISRLIPGVYFIQVQNGVYSFQKKLIVD
ncbi:MAG: T9SS type A sorting domain-containing protein [Bacteroidia bacterium]|nr:T9SS type A sorting domain-containing protein [Bacteroidia bacterium]